jgi:hypothetical protein
MKSNDLIINNYTDYISTRHSMEKNKETSGSTFKTDITIVDYSGEKVISVKKHRHNMTILGGRIDLLEKVFHITPNPEQHLLLNNMIPQPVPASQGNSTTFTTPIRHSINVFSGSGTAPHAQAFNRYVGYFCIGTGGENLNVPYTIYDVKPWETRLYHMVPFRFLPIGTDFTSTEAANYRLRKVVTLNGQSYAAYFAKKFDVGVVRSKMNDIDYIAPGVLTSAHSEPYLEGNNHPMQGFTVSTYVDFTLDVDNLEFKEYWAATHDNTYHLARLSELGLITGYDATTSLDPGPTGKELSCAELFAKLTHEVVFLSSASSRRKVMYKIYT